MEETNQPVYIGDGVYVTFDGYGVELRLNSHTDPVAVYLEPNVMDTLIAYYKRVTEVHHD